MAAAAPELQRASRSTDVAPLSARVFATKRPPELASLQGSPIGVLSGALPMGSISSERSPGAGAETGSSSSSSPRRHLSPSVVSARARRRASVDSSSAVVAARASAGRAQLEARHAVWEQAWKETEQLMKEQIIKQAKARDERAEALLHEIERGSEIRGLAEDFLRKHDKGYLESQSRVHAEWDEKVAARIEKEIVWAKMGSPRLPDGQEMPTLRDPLKRDLRAHREEEGFHRLATAILQGSPRVERWAATAELGGPRARLEARSRMRPTMPVETWDKCAMRAPGRFFDAVRKEEAESGGVFVGARRVGETSAFVGEASQYQNDLGASCAAPCQDHYHFERGKAITDREFPLGKRRVLPSVLAHQL